MRSLLLAAVLLLAALVAAAPAGATAVAYVEGGRIWLSSPDGTLKRDVSGASDTVQVWSEVAQSDEGHVLGVRREPGKIANLNSTRLWAPDGSVAGDGALTVKPGRTIYALPIGLDLTPNGKTVVYGFSNSTGFGVGTTYESGAYVAASSGWYTEPFQISGAVVPALGGSRIVTAQDDVVRLQRATGQPPYSTEFDGWVDTNDSAGGWELFRADLAASGTVLAWESAKWSGGTQTAGRIGVASVDGPGGALRPGDCFLPAQGVARDVSLAPDGSLIAWRDARGIVVAGVPAFDGAEPCTLTRPAVVISATGTSPALGGATVSLPPAPPAPPAPPSGGGAAPGGAAGGAGGRTTGTGPGTPGTTSPGAADRPRVTLAATVTARALRRGLPLTVTVPRAGTVRATAKVGRTTVARAAAKARRAGAVRLRLRSRRAARYRGRTLTITVAAPGGTVKLTRRLR